MQKLLRKERKMLLALRDQQLIQKQCELQNAVSEEEVANFGRAYYLAKLFATTANWNKIGKEALLLLVHLLGEITEPETKGRWRLVPARFAGGQTALDGHLIDEAIEKWAELWVEGEVSAEELYKEFEQIHPFIDGNGRVGHLLWAINVSRETGVWPEELPPDLFGSEVSSNYQSAFGEIED